MRRIYSYDSRSRVPAVRRAANSDRKRAKIAALREEGTLHSAPEKVRDPKFQDSDFFDPRDAVQVKYEMLRRVSSRRRR
jgi:predicted Zn-dependent protease